MAQYPYAPQPPAYQPPRAKPQLLWIIAAIIIIAIILVVGIWLLLPSSPEPISFTVKASTSNVKQGEPLSLSQTLSPGDPTTITYSVENLVTKVILLDHQETVAEGQAAPSSIEIDIPEDAPPGRYTLTASAKREGRETKSSFVFRITRKPTESEITLTFSSLWAKLIILSS